MTAKTGKSQNRRYLNELHDFGYSERRIAKETGISKSSVHRILKGTQKPPKSDTKQYEVMRNACRRAAYTRGRERGLPSKLATLLRRKEPTEVMKVKSKVWEVKQPSFEQTVYQMALVGDFYNAKLKAWAYDVECYSYAHIEVNIALMVKECEAQGQAQLGGSDWVLITIKKQIITEIKASGKAIQEE
jgi:IS30 family transposase